MACEYTPVFYHNFTRSFATHSFEHKIAADGDVSRNGTGLIISTPHYTVHGKDDGLDHIKWLGFLCKSYEVSEGEFIYEACLAAQQIITPAQVPNIYRSRIRNINEDYRLCSSGLIVYDETSMITAQILFTNDYIYGYYERRPHSKPNWCSIPSELTPGSFPIIENSFVHDYAGFVAIIPLCRRGHFSPGCDSNLDDFCRVGIGIDPGKGTIKYYINRIELFCIPKIGYRLPDEYEVVEYGGTPYLTTPNCMRFGFGHFSYLDHNIPNNYARDYVVEATDAQGFPIHRLSSALAQLLSTEKYREPYPSFTGEYIPIDPNITFAYTGTDQSFFNFGQGMITKIKYIAGYVVNTRLKLCRMLCNTTFTCHESETEEEDMYGPVPEISQVQPIIPSLIPLYQDVSVKANSDINSEANYSLGDLYHRSRTRQLITKGEIEEPKEKVIDESEQIIFSTQDMSLII